MGLEIGSRKCHPTFKLELKILFIIVRKNSVFHMSCSLICAGGYYWIVWRMRIFLQRKCVYVFLQIISLCCPSGIKMKKNQGKSRRDDLIHPILLAGSADPQFLDRLGRCKVRLSPFVRMKNGLLETNLNLSIFVCFLDEYMNWEKLAK